MATRRTTKTTSRSKTATSKPTISKSTAMVTATVNDLLEESTIPEQEDLLEETTSELEKNLELIPEKQDSETGIVVVQTAEREVAVEQTTESRVKQRKQNRRGPSELPSADELASFMNALSLSKEQFAKLLDMDKLSFSQWLAKGMTSARGTGERYYQACNAMLAQSAEEKSGEITLPIFAQYVRLASNGELARFYMSHVSSGDMVQEYFETISRGGMLAVMFAIVFDLFLQNSGHAPTWKIFQGMRKPTDVMVKTRIKRIEQLKEMLS